MKTVSLLREVYTPKAKVVEESSNVYLEGIFMEAEIKNNNNRKYPHTVLEREAEKLQNIISEGRALGELDHPESLNINLDRVSHVVEKLDRYNTDYKWAGRIRILPTPMGNIAKSLTEAGIPLAISSRGVGSLSESDGVHLVGSDFKLITFDIVHSPGAPNAFLSLREGQQYVVEDGQYFPIFKTFPNDLQYIPESEADVEYWSQNVIEYISMLKDRS